MVTFGSDVVAQAPCVSENGLNYNNKQRGKKRENCAQHGYILPPIVSATQLTPLYIKAAYIAALHRYSEARLIERS